MPPPLKISVLRPARLNSSKVCTRRLVVLERPLETRLEALDVLRAAVVADDPPQLEMRQLVNELRQSQGLRARGHARPRAHRDIDDDIGDDAGFPGGVERSRAFSG